MEKHKEKDIIDRHSKKRAILIDDELLLNRIVQDYMHEIIDIAEISIYYDCIILTNDLKYGYINEYLDKWGLTAKVIKKFADYQELKEQYRFLVLFSTKKNAKELKNFYKSEVLVR